MMLAKKTLASKNITLFRSIFSQRFMQFSILLQNIGELWYSQSSKKFQLKVPLGCFCFVLRKTMHSGKSFELGYIFAKMYRLSQKSPKIPVHFRFWFRFWKSTFWPSKIGYFDVGLYVSVSVSTYFFCQSPYNFRNIFDGRKSKKSEIPGKSKGQKFLANAWP